MTAPALKTCLRLSVCRGAFVSKNIPLFLSLLLLSASYSHAQTTETRGTIEDSLATHYEAAQRAQSAGDTARAELEYKLFLSQALQRLAGRRAASGASQQAVDLLHNALVLTPNDAALRLDYAKACRGAGDLAKAKAAAENVLTLEPRNAKAQTELGLILAQMGDDSAATAHFETAVALEPTFENGYALAKEFLKRKDPDRASKIFTEMLASFGDSPELRMEFGRAYAEAGYPERAIPEFQSALAQNEKVRGGHYSLGAAYLLGLGEAMQDKAEGEFRKELQNYPDDPLSLYQLGSIEFNRHAFDSAERELSKAAKLDSRNPDAYLLLGQIYNETDQPAEAELAFRKCIELTTQVSRNHYQVQRAHYLLSRILSQSGRADEARQEMNVANDLMKRTTISMQGGDVSARVPETAEASAPAPRVDPEKKREADAFEEKIKGAVADSYNNLGAMAASAGNFSAALPAFQQAAKWNPQLEGLDSNWGRAAFSAGDYPQAIPPLSRVLAAHPEDTWARAALGSSFFSAQNYKESARTLQPMEQSLGDRPQLDYIYSVSLLKSGDTATAVRRLETLQQSNPNVALIPEALAEAYASLGQSEKAARERELAAKIHSAVSTSPLPSQPN